MLSLDDTSRTLAGGILFIRDRMRNHSILAAEQSHSGTTPAGYRTVTVQGRAARRGPNCPRKLRRGEGGYTHSTTRAVIIPRSTFEPQLLQPR